MTTPGGRTAFLDRDGTINREQSFITHPDQLVLLPGVVEALHRLAAADVRIVIVTNQSGIARGLYTQTGLARVHETLHQRLDRLPLAYLHCPHHPDFDGPYGGPCTCRKPAAGLLHEAEGLLDVSFEDGLLVGDSARDLLMAKDLPLRTVHVRSGKPFAAEAEKLAAAGFTADHVADDLATAVDWYLGR
ncbi:MAG: HAD-IIIA family hydrolase [bacterium]|nr:HAD-IIIA family hydrolase [bacterium]